MLLEPLYTVTFMTPEDWSVEVAEDTGIEGGGSHLAERRPVKRLSVRYRAANFPANGRSCPSSVGCSKSTTAPR